MGREMKSGEKVLQMLRTQDTREETCVQVNIMALANQLI